MIKSIITLFIFIIANVLNAMLETGRTFIIALWNNPQVLLLVLGYLVIKYAMKKVRSYR